VQERVCILAFLRHVPHLRVVRRFVSHFRWAAIGGWEEDGSVVAWPCGFAIGVEMLFCSLSSSRVLCVGGVRVRGRERSGWMRVIRKCLIFRGRRMLLLSLILSIRLRVLWMLMVEAKMQPSMGNWTIPLVPTLVGAAFTDIL